MYDNWCEVITAHVGPKMVVGFDALGYFQHCLASGLKYPIKFELGLKDPVYSFSYRVFVRLSIFGHTDGYIIALQQ